MKKVSVLSLIAFVAIVISSCGSSNNVVSNRLISKRKYNKGIFLNRKANFKTADAKVKQADLKEEKAIAKEERVEKRKAKKLEKLNVNKNSDVLADDTKVKKTSIETTQFNSLPQHNVQITPGPDALFSDETNGIEWSVTENPNTQARETMKEMTHSYNDKSSNKKSSSSNQSRSDAIFVLAVIFAILLPPLGVAIYTNIDWMKVLIAFLLTLLGVLPGVIYALLVVFDVI